MDLRTAVTEIKEKGRGASTAAKAEAEIALKINDGSCSNCGLYRFGRDLVYLHPFHCEFTKRQDHNLMGIRTIK